MSGFDLNALLRLRRVEEDRAAADLSRRHSQRDIRAKAAQELAARIGGLSSPTVEQAVAFRASLSSRLALAGELSVANAATATATEEVAEATRSWAAARGKVGSLESLYEQWLAEKRREAQRAEQVEVDDLVTARWAADRAPSRQTGPDEIAQSPDRAPDDQGASLKISGEQDDEVRDKDIDTDIDGHLDTDVDTDRDGSRDHL